MNSIKEIIFILLLSLSSPCQADFQIYDGLLYKHKPDLSQFKLKEIPIIYESTLLSNNKPNQLPGKLNISHAVSIINQSTSDKAVIDIERWPTKGSNKAVSNSLSKYITVIQDIKNRGITASIGYYGAPPIQDYWRAISDHKSSKFISWQTDNNNLQSLVDVVDVLYPSLYTFYNDQEGWIKFATAQINEARRIAKGKPVIVFLWPKYHDSNRSLKNQYLPIDFWKTQLKTAKSLADGVIIWGGWQEEWNSDAEWWIETLRLINNGL